jgi:Helix-turn-helix domain
MDIPGRAPVRACPQRRRTVADNLIYPIGGIQEMLGGIGRTTVYELIKSGDLEVVKIGSRTFATRAALETLIERLRAEQHGGQAA